MRTNEAHIFVLISCIIIGILISMNIDFKSEKINNFLSVDQYQNAYADRSKLYNEISNLKSQYRKYNSKLAKYKNSEEDRYKIIADIQDELQENKAILGMTDVEGEGITITVNDAIDEYNTTGSEDYLVHFYDIIFIINDLKSAGAEAIEVNGQRIVDGTYDYCGGTNIKLNEITIVSPFYINAIGNKDVMEKYMLMNENYLKYLMILRKINVDVKVQDNIKINSYVGSKEYKKAKPKIK